MDFKCAAGIIRIQDDRLSVGSFKRKVPNDGLAEPLCRYEFAFVTLSPVVT
jgi:hypothetical protein